MNHDVSGRAVCALINQIFGSAPTVKQLGRIAAALSGPLPSGTAGGKRQRQRVLIPDPLLDLLVAGFYYTHGHSVGYRPIFYALKDRHPNRARCSCDLQPAAASIRCGLRALLCGRAHRQSTSRRKP